VAANISSDSLIWFSTTCAETDYYAGGARVRKVANGFEVTPSSTDLDSETYVFADAAQMSAFLRKRYTPKPAQKKKAGG
jgi:hypothetical protein